MKIDEADVYTFEVFPERWEAFPEKYDVGHEKSYAKDKNHVYRHGKILEGENPEGFQLPEPDF